MNISNEIKLRAEEISDDLIAIRRHLHANPELSFQEENTSAYISGELDRLSIPYTTGWAGYGIVGFIEGTKGQSQKTRGPCESLHRHPPRGQKRTPPVRGPVA